VREFQAEAGELDELAAAVAGREGLARDRMLALNDAIAKVERAFLRQEGLPGRQWFKHTIYAPGLTTGYAAWPLPAIRQALEDKNSEALAAATADTAARIRGAARALRTAVDRARAALEAHEIDH
jgi:N-acetylated-alpha-linked acidic dipeptidase